MKAGRQVRLLVRTAAMTLLFVLLGTGVAQAALQNGNFDSSNRLHWQSYETAGGSSPGLGISGTNSFDTTGNGASPAAIFQVSNLFPDGQQQGGGIYQDVTLTPGQWKLAADIASNTPDMGGGSWADCGLYTLSLGATPLASREFTDCASDTTQRAHLEGTLSVATAGTYRVQIGITRRSQFSPFNPFQYVDNVTLEPYTPPPPNLVRPVLAASTGNAAATEGGAPSIVDGALGVSDSDSSDLTGATVRILSGFKAGDFLSHSDLGSGPISGSYDAEEGVLTLTGTAPLATYRDVLRSVAFWTSNDVPGTARTVQFTVNDGVGDSNTATRGVTVTPVNDAPVLLADMFGTAYTWGAVPMQVAPDAVVSDPDSATIIRASAEIFFGFETGDRLEFTAPAGITGNYDPASYKVTFTGPASASAYQTALRSVRFASSSPNPPTPFRAILLSVSDGDQTSSAGVQFNVVQVNQAPVVTMSSGSLGYTEGDGAKAIDPDLFVTDVDDPVLTSATVRISSGFAPGDVLEYASEYTTVYGIAGSYDSGTGVLTFSGRASKLLYQAAMRTVAFSTPSDDPSTSRTISFAGSNGGPAGAAGTRTVAITPVNDAPTVTAGAGSLAYTEGDAAKVLDSGVTLADVDDANLAGASVRVASGFVNGDVLEYTTLHGIAGSYDSATGTLTLSGSATKADYRDALRSIAFRTSSDDPGSSRTVQFTVDDGDDDSASADRGVAITAVNDTPTVTTSGGSLAYTEGEAGKVLDGGVTVADVDDVNLAGASLRLSSAFEAGDVLEYTPVHGIAGSYDSTTGVLTLTGAASKVDYQDALRSVRFGSTKASPATAKTVAITVNDGDADGASAQRAIALTRLPTDDPPPDDTPPTDDDPPKDTPPADNNTPQGGSPDGIPPASTPGAPTGPNGSGGPPQTSPGDSTAPVLRSLTVRAPKKLKAFLATGLPFAVQSSEPGQVSAKLLLDRATAKRNRIKGAAVGNLVTVGELKATRLASTGKTTFTVKLSKDAARRLKKVPKLRLTLRVTATDAAGNAGAPKSVTVTLKR